MSKPDPLKLSGQSVIHQGIHETLVPEQDNHQTAGLDWHNYRFK